MIEYIYRSVHQSKVQNVIDTFVSAGWRIYAFGRDGQAFDILFYRES